MVFLIPFIASEDDDEEDSDDDELEKQPLLILKDWMVCKDAILILLDYGRKKWKMCDKAVVHNWLPSPAQALVMISKSRSNWRETLSNMSGRKQRK
jgi:hypothetical protein